MGKIKTHVVLIAFCLILLMPLFLGNRLEIERSTDMETHLGVISNMLNSMALPPLNYWGDIIIGWPVALLIKFVNLPANIRQFLGLNVANLYIVFNFLVLIGVAVSIYFVSRKLVGISASNLIIPITLFCTTGILGLFKYGVIFSIINMYIILPFAIYFGIRWLTKRGWYNLSVAICLFALFSVFHITAMYLPYAFGLLLVGVVVYKLISKSKMDIKPILALSVIVLALNIVLTKYFLPQASILTQSAITDAVQGIANPSSIASALPSPSNSALTYGAVMPLQFVRDFLSLPTLLLFCLAVVGYILLSHKLTLARMSPN